jgi:hypothetical protein
MAKRAKRIKKRIESLKKQIDIHEKKIADHKGISGKEEVIGYWAKEIANRQREIDFGLNVLKKKKTGKPKG